MSSFLTLVNKVLTDTGLGGTITTVANVDPRSDEGKVIKWIQDAQRDTARDVPNAPLKFYGNIATVADVEDTVDVTNGSSSVVTTAATSSWAGRLFHVQGDAETYRILKYISATEIILADFAGNELGYRGDTATSVTGQVAQDRYLLPGNFKAPISTQDFFNVSTLKYKSPEDYDIENFDVQGSPFVLGQPSKFTIFSISLETGVPRYYAEFRPIPTEVYHYPFRYYGSPAIMDKDTDVSGYPDIYEQAIVAKARSYVYRFAMRDSELAVFEERDYNRVVNKQQSNPIEGRSAFQLQPETGRSFWNDAYG